jgi:hypothetical protein
LQILGFSAEPFADSESEFDVVFTSVEGRFIGEVEGTDSRPINIDKLSQLERNIQEDFARDTTTEFARGVLFGNPGRLLDPAERTNWFTEKCISGAKRTGITLVTTPGLFRIVQYLQETRNDAFAQMCRKAFLDGSGRVAEFPPTPDEEEKDST